MEGSDGGIPGQFRSGTVKFKGSQGRNFRIMDGTKEVGVIGDSVKMGMGW